jgi:DNA-3-methyladenine glycosylase
MTARTTVMFGPPGRLYVYFTYGMHWCANVVCGSTGQAAAVLLRAGEPVEGIEAMRARRPAIRDDRLLAAGPARLTQAMGIDQSQNGASLLRGGELWCAQDRLSEEWRAGSARTGRIGLTPGKGDDLPWRFVIRGHPYASRRV